MVRGSWAVRRARPGEERAQGSGEAAEEAGHRPGARAAQVLPEQGLREHGAQARVRAGQVEVRDAQAEARSRAAQGGTVDRDG